MFCFANILNIFFLFVTCSMHKNPHQNAENGIKETLFFKIFPGEHAPGLPRVSRANSCSPPPPPKFLSPYAYDGICISCIMKFLYLGFIINLCNGMECSKHNMVKSPYLFSTCNMDARNIKFLRTHNLIRQDYGRTCTVP